MRRTLVAVALAGRLAAVFATAAQTPKHVVRLIVVSKSGWTGSGGQLVLGSSRQEAQVTIGRSSCSLQMEPKTYAGAACQTPKGSPSPSAASVSRLLAARTGGSHWHCLGSTPLAFPSRSEKFVSVVCFPRGGGTG